MTNQRMAMFKKFWPQKNDQFDSAPWGWVVSIVAIECVLGQFSIALNTWIKNGTHSWIGVAVGLATATPFALHAERLSPDVMSPKIIRQLSIRVSVTLTTLGILYLVVEYLSDPDDFLVIPTPIYPLIAVVAYLVSWGIHRFGFAQGKKLAIRERSQKNIS